ncbi:MAG: MoaD/ThiS family protein [Thermoplasmata archaeon]|nr:MoaD/ThiS family protein [Thermoplasmata archaeon]MCI4356797.1 MoaD/ThiS family protein [Thermoplasmata archaeon]
MVGTVVVRLYATAREAVGNARLERPAGPHGVSVGGLLDALSHDYPALAPILRHARFARNGSYLRGRSGRLRPGDELAIHPPYSGG